MPTPTADDTDANQTGEASPDPTTEHPVARQPGEASTSRAAESPVCDSDQGAAEPFCPPHWRPNHHGVMPPPQRGPTGELRECRGVTFSHEMLEGGHYWRCTHPDCMRHGKTGTLLKGATIRDAKCYRHAEKFHPECDDRNAAAKRKAGGSDVRRQHVCGGGACCRTGDESTSVRFRPALPGNGQFAVP